MSTSKILAAYPGGETLDASGERVPSAWSAFLFFVLLSGPPKFRVRDSGASLAGEVDWIIILHIALWLLAGFWVAKTLTGQPSWRFSTPEKLGIMLAALLGISALYSEAVFLTAFKAYQLLVSVLFAAAFVRRYGIRACLDHLLFGNLLLCVADAVAAFLAPELVYVVSEFGMLRFRGDLLAQTGTVSAFAVVLLVTTERKLSRPVRVGAFIICGAVLVFSLMRTAYLAVLMFLLLVVLRGKQLPTTRRVAFGLLIAVVVCLAAGMMPSISDYRAAETVWTLSDRLGLWTHLILTTLDQSPWLGLGYFSASRVYGPEYNPDLGTAHSGFIEVFAGGGIVAASVYVALWCVLSMYAARLLRRGTDVRALTLCGLLVVVGLFNAIGGAIEADPVGFTFWCLVTSIPMQYRSLTPERVKALTGRATPAAAVA